VDVNRMNGLYNDLRSRIESLGCDCVGFELVREGGMEILRVYIDMPGGVDLSDCETVARELNCYLDAADEDILPERYFLEVSSPGVERPLFTPDDYARFVGMDAEVTLRGGKKITGTIEAADESSVRMALKGASVTAAFADIARGKLLYKENRGEKKTFKKIPPKKKKKH